MAEQLAFMRKAGGTKENKLIPIKETVLWSNPSPATAVTTTTYNLSDSILNYDYLAIAYRQSTTDATEYKCIMPVADFAKDAMYFGTISPANYVRRAHVYNSDNTIIRITTSMGQGTTDQSTSMAIPLQIIGVKIDTDNEYTDFELVALGQSSSEIGSSGTVTLNDNLSNYKYVVISMSEKINDVAIRSISAIQPIQIVSEVDYFKSNPINGAYATGATGSAQLFGATFTYTNETSIAVTKANTTGRYIYVYGIKATRKEKKEEKYESQIWKNVAAGGIPTFTTQGMAKAIWAVRVIPNAGAIRAVTYTNVNPSTGQINSDGMYYYDSSSPSTPAELNNKFIVTNNQITLQASLSSTAHMVQLNYTY